MSRAVSRCVHRPVHLPVHRHVHFTMHRPAHPLITEGTDMTASPRQQTLLGSTLALALSALLAACGGGGAAAEPTAGNQTSPSPATTTTATAATVATTTAVADLVPGDGMTWDMSAERALTITVTGPDGLPANAAGVRVFSLSRTSPHDGSALEAPVPVSLLDSGTSDTAGRVTVTLRLPGHLAEVLVVATLGDAQAQGTVANDGQAASLGLNLTR